MRFLLPLLILLVVPASALAQMAEFADSDRDVQADGDTLALAVSPDGGSVASIGMAGGKRRVYRYDSSGRQLARFRVRASAALALAPGGFIYVGSDKGTVRRYSADGALLDTFRTGAPIRALAADAAGNLYVAFIDSVSRYDSGGAATGTFTGLGKVAGVAVGADGTVYAADSDAQQVVVLGASGDRLRTIGDGLAGLSGVGVDGAGRVFVADGQRLRVFAADGREIGPIDAGLFADGQRLSEPLLLGVGMSGDVYWVPYNPDIEKLPAAAVFAPRFRLEDQNRASNEDYDQGPVPVSLGRAYRVVAKPYASAARDVSASIELPPGVRLVSQPGDSEWVVSPAPLGRHVVTVRFRGRAPDGSATELVKRFPLYAVRKPHVGIVGAVLLPRAHQIFVGAIVGLGRLHPPNAFERFELQDYFDVATFDIRARSASATDYSFGGPFDGACQPLLLKRGRSGRRPIKITASFSGVGTVGAAKATRTIRPVVHTHSKLLKSCVEASGFAGGPTG